MARPLRFEYRGAVYHVMARGDGGKLLFIGREDHESFLYWLDRVCVSHGWRVHAWVLMGKGNTPAWLELNRVLEAFQLNHDRRGRGALLRALATLRPEPLPIAKCLSAFPLFVRCDENSWCAGDWVCEAGHSGRIG